MEQKNYGTRMHSSRMPTVRSRRVSAEGGCLPRRVWCIPAGTGADSPREQNDRQV